ncbi:MAG: hypothetical protein M3P23_06315 [Actinomycetota bacterium]|nr:hypothetical protein [Actinomycetota bacterium]
MGQRPDDAREVLRGVWSAEGQTSADLDDTPPPKVCKRMTEVGFDGMAGPGGDLKAAWRAKLEREGKLRPSAGTIADLVLGPESAR